MPDWMVREVQDGHPFTAVSVGPIPGYPFAAQAQICSRIQSGNRRAQTHSISEAYRQEHPLLLLNDPCHVTGYVGVALQYLGKCQQHMLVPIVAAAVDAQVLGHLGRHFDDVTLAALASGLHQQNRVADCQGTGVVLGTRLFVGQQEILQAGELTKTGLGRPGSTRVLNVGQTTQRLLRPTCSYIGSANGVAK